MSAPKSIDEYTVNTLRHKCKRDGLKNYSRLDKKQLYAYCVLEEKSIDIVLAKMENSKAKEEEEICVTEEDYEKFKKEYEEEPEETVCTVI
uniref:Uncharacterized protein n=1 Tax=Marseillevirus LCMAC102 TaxID=2506603 RepID=A0A481YUG9_9VIRU|nr:MAG: hypothetical protein LCMAC102_03720 [Marseillevirus LCMAC102]